MKTNLNKQDNKINYHSQLHKMKQIIKFKCNMLKSMRSKIKSNI